MKSWSAGITASTANPKDFERGEVDKLGGKPPVRMVPEAPDKDDDEEKRPTFTQRIGENVKETYPKFTGGSIEDTLLHVAQFWALEDKLGLKAAFTSAAEIARTEQERLDKLQKGTKEYKELKKELASSISVRESCRDDFWQLFERMLHAPLVPKWQEIVVTETDTDGYVARGGTRQTGKRGKTMTAMGACIRTWLLEVCKFDAAERHRRYLSTQVKMPPKGVTVEAFVNRMVELNKYLKYLPTLKDKEGCPTEVPRGDKPFSDYELCEHILQAIPYKFAVAYWAKQGPNHFPSDVKTLKEELKLIEPQFEQTQRLLDQVRNSKAKDKPSMKSDKEPIPRKTLGKGKGNADKGPKKPQGRGQRYCNRCAKKSPQWANTHNTSDCRKWDKDGNPLDRAAKSVHAHHQGMEEMRECFAQFRKEAQKMMKSVKRRKSHRKGSSKRARYSDSESSDSDSE